MGARGLPLDLGRDGLAFAGASIRSGSYHQAMLHWASASAAWIDYNSGDAIEVKVNHPRPFTIQTHVIFANSTYIEIDLSQHKDPIDVSSIGQWSGFLKNDHKQWTLFLESKVYG
jgi:hypothetical protein